MNGNGNGLKKAELESLLTGWKPKVYGVAYGAAEDTGGALAGLISAKASPGAAYLASLPLRIAHAFTQTHPNLRILTSVGPGMGAGAIACKTFVWIKLKEATAAEAAAAAE